MPSLLNVTYEIDTRSTVPSYRQLAALLEAEIRAGAFADGPLPSLVTLRQMTGLAPMTIRKAIQVLADDGLVVKVPGRGTYPTRDGG